MKRAIPILPFLLLIAFTMFFCSSCNSFGVQENPKQMLSESMAELNARDHFTFQGTSQIAISGYILQKDQNLKGYIVNRNQKDNQWVSENYDVSTYANLLQGNPLIKLEQLNAVRKTVQWNKQLSKGKERVLHISIDPQDMKRIVLAELRQGQQKLLSDAKRGAPSNKALNSNPQAEVEIEKVLQRFNNQMEEVNSSLTVDCGYNLWIDYSTHLPQRMIVETIMKYTLQGQNKQETSTASYTFQNYNKQNATPKPSS